MARFIFSVEEWKRYFAWERENKWGLRPMALYCAGAVLAFLSGRLGEGAAALILGASGPLCELSAIIALIFALSEYPGEDAPKRYYAYSFALFLLSAAVCNRLFMS
jgi:hypothetical protein